RGLERPGLPIELDPGDVGMAGQSNRGLAADLAGHHREAFVEEAWPEVFRRELLGQALLRGDPAHTASRLALRVGIEQQGASGRRAVADTDDDRQLFGPPSQLAQQTRRGLWGIGRRNGNGTAR